MCVLFKRTEFEWIAVALVALVIGCLTSWFYWGYPFSRPRVPEQLVRAAHVESLTNLQCTTSDFRAFDCRALEEKEGSRGGRIASARQYEDHVVDGRVLLPLADAARFPEAAPRDDSLEVAELLALARDYVTADPGYRYGGWLWGYAAVVRDEHGSRTAVVSMQSGEVSNDHHVLYERVFRRENDGWHLLNSERFFFDVAGIEGFEWPYLHGFLLVLTLLAWATIRCAMTLASRLLATFLLSSSAVRSLG